MGLKLIWFAENIWFILYSVKLEMLDIKTQTWSGVDKKYMVTACSGTSKFYYFKYFFHFFNFFLKNVKNVFTFDKKM